MSDDDLRRLLSDAADYAPERDLIGGAVRSADRRRAVGRAVSVAAVSVAAVLMGAFVVNLNGNAQLGVPATAPGSPTPTMPPTQTPSASPTSAATTAPPPSPQVDETRSPTPQPITTTTLANPTMPVAFPIPNEAAFRQADFDRKLTRFLDSGDYPRTATAMGLTCNLNRPDALQPIAGRGWWWLQNPKVMRSFGVELNITGWSDASHALAELKNDTGQCTYGGPYTVIESKPDRYLFRLGTGAKAVIAIERVNNVLVAVTVTPGPDDSKATVQSEAERLLQIAVQRAYLTGLDKAS